MTSTASPADDHAYFQAIESSFIRLRGAPLLLSPSDWQMTQEWHRQGIPLELVLAVLEEVFASRRARGVKGKVQGLRYCAPAVEKAWSDRRELTATGNREAPAPLNLIENLERLSQTLRQTPLVAEDLAVRVAGLEGAPEEVEAELVKLDRQMIETAGRQIDTATMAEIQRSIEESLTKVRSRLDDSELDRMRARLLRESIRRHSNLPVLSLFVADPR